MYQNSYPIIIYSIYSYVYLDNNSLYIILLFIHIAYSLYIILIYYYLFYVTDLLLRKDILVVYIGLHS